jgi:hypothetical protein
MALTYRGDHTNAGETSEDADVVEGRFVELVPNERVIQLVTFQSDDPAFAGEMRMTWKLSPAPGGTEVTSPKESARKITTSAYVRRSKTSLDSCNDLRGASDSKCMRLEISGHPLHRGEERNALERSCSRQMTIVDAASKFRLIFRIDPKECPNSRAPILAAALAVE